MTDEGSTRVWGTALLAGVCVATAAVVLTALPHGTVMPQAKAHHTHTHANGRSRGFGYLFGVDDTDPTPDMGPEWTGQ